MKIKRKKLGGINIADSGALSDLAFLLIIFFIVIAVFNVNKGFLLGLPQKKSTKIVNVEDIIKVTLYEDGKLFYKDTEITLADMSDMVKEKIEARPNMTFLLKIAPETKYQDVVSAVDTILQLDVDNFSFSMLEE